MNVFDIFKDRAGQQPEHPAIISGGITFTYAGLLKEIESKAEILSKSGIQKGSCLGIHLTNCPEYIIMTYAGWMLGACIVPVASEMTPEEKLHLCGTIALDAVVSRSRDSQLFDPVRKNETIDLSNGLNLIPIRKSRQHPEGFHGINPAFLRFTSGTTGNAKGVVISHESIKDRIHAANRVLNIGPDDKVLWLLSMAYHFTVSIVSYLSFGATIVLSAGFLGEIIIKALQNMKCTIIYASPTHYQLMSNTGAADLSGLRLAVSTTSGLASEIADRFYQLFHVPLSQAYGIIEVGLPFINVDNPVGKSKSVGRILPDFQVLLEDRGMGENLKTIKLRGKGFFDAYYEPWSLRADCLKDGWFDTGDFGIIDNEGFLFITGRSKEMINLAGMKFFPKEVEEVLEKHPAVEEAYVFPHSKKPFEEVPHAHIVIRKNAMTNMSGEKLEAELAEHCARHVSQYKIPEKFIFVDKLPRTASGKLIRRGQDKS